MKKGFRHTIKTKKKISEANKGRFVSDKTRLKHSLAAKGRIVSNETRLKISIAQKGKPKFTEEQKKKMGLSQKKRFQNQKHPLKGYKFSKESREKMSLSKKKFYENGGQVWNKGMKFPEKSGENHFAWKGGISSLKKKLKVSFAWREWRKKIFERDGYKCFDCGENTTNLEPHHIISLKADMKGIFNVNNGITLCRPCHIKTMGKELKLARIYFSFVQALV